MSVIAWFRQLAKVRGIDLASEYRKIRCATGSLLEPIDDVQNGQFADLVVDIPFLVPALATGSPQSDSLHPARALHKAIVGRYWMAIQREDVVGVVFQSPLTPGYNLLLHEPDSWHKTRALRNRLSSRRRWDGRGVPCTRLSPSTRRGDQSFAAGAIAGRRPDAAV